MLAAVNFWGTPAALALAIGLATGAAFLLGVMLFGTASRRRQQKIIGERMAAVGNRGRKVSQCPPWTARPAAGSPRVSPTSDVGSPTHAGSADGSTPSSRPRP